MEIDVTKGLVHSIKIELPSGKVIQQSVTYEFVMRLCSFCSMIGHNVAKCTELRAKRNKPDETKKANDKRPKAT